MTRKALRFLPDASTIRKVLLLLLASSPLAAQNRFPPDSLVNLKVLARTMTPREVLNVMRGFTQALGVRCPYCHKGEEGQPLNTFDFPSDDKRAKLIAREMMKMTSTINDQTITQLPDRPDTALRVACITCHRGVARPVPLDRIVVQAAAASADSAVNAYRALRGTYYGRAAYDFSEGTLVAAASALGQQKEYDTALKLLTLDNEFYPQGAELMLAMGDIQRAKGDTAAAIKSYRETLARDPRNGQARQRLAQLGQQP